MNKQRADEEELKILANRLATSTYDEDKLETLASIYEISKTSPVSVGTMCLKNVYASVEGMDGIDLQMRILENVISTRLRNEFIEILFDNPSNIDLVLKRDEKEIYRFLSIFSSECFDRAIAINPAFSSACVKLVRSELFTDISKYLQWNNSIKEQLAFDGIFEVLFTHIARSKDNKSKVQIEKVVLLLLKNSIPNQNYLIESPKYKFLLSNIHFEMFTMLLNPCNLNLKAIQAGFLIPRILHGAVESKQYEFLNMLCIESPDNLFLLFTKYVTIDIAIEDSEFNIYSLEMLENYIKVSDAIIPRSTSYRINMVLSHLEKNPPVLVEKVINDFCNRNISIEKILYIILTFADLDQISEYVRIDQYEGLQYQLVLVLNLMHGVKIDKTRYQILDDLKQLRLTLCRSPVF